MTQAQNNILMTDPEFRGRIKVCSLTYARYIANEGPGVPAHNTRFQWSRTTMQQPDITAQNLQPNVVLDEKVQAAGVDVDGHSLITDENLQLAVETTVNMLL